VRVLFIVTAYPRAPGDVITPWLLETIGRLRARGVEVEVLAPAYRGLGDQEVEGVQVHRFRYAPRGWETLTHDQTAPDRVRERPWYLALVPGYVLAGRRAARRLARSGRFDVVHAFWPLPHGLLGMAAKRGAGTPLVSTFFGVELTWLESQLGFLRPVVRSIIRASDAVTVISSHTAAAVRRVAPEVPVRTIPFGAAVEVPDTDAEPPRRAPGEPYRLLFVGRLVERKGVQVLLAALPLLRARHSVRLSVVGEGSLRPALEARARALGIADRVEFTGAVSAAELNRCFRECDAFVLPAVRDAKGDVEGLGVVLMEALLHGRPVIASSSGGIVDIVRHGETGLLATPGDPGSLAAAIARYIEDPELADRLARAGREHVLRAFSWDAITDELLAVYRQVAPGAEEPN
jgi:glycosyltransferase involved in cell wall biosynthesis